jgi:predicted RNase H-like nuclease (RuvC/YqgF family)
MPRLSITISGDLNDELESKRQDDERFSSKADVVRHYIKRGRRVGELEREIEHRDARIEELRNQMTARENQGERIDALERRIEEQQVAADAPFPVKWYRWLKRRS